MRGRREPVGRWPVLVLLLAVLATGCSTRPDIQTAVTAEGAFSFPSQPGDLAFTVPVSLNGSPPLPFIVDTGSTATALYPRAVAALETPSLVEGRAFVWGIAAAEVRPLIHIGEITMGSSRRTDVPAVLLDRPSAPTPLAGLVGLDLLAHYAMVWLPEEGSLTFIPNEAFLADAFAGWEMLPIGRAIPEGRSKRLATISMRIGNRPVAAIIDTGSAVSFANWQAVRSDPIIAIVRRRLRRRWEIEGAIGSFEPRIAAEFERLRIGTETWSGGTLIVADLPAFVPEDGRPVPIVILGADFWVRQGFAIDLQGGRLFLPPEER